MEKSISTLSLPAGWSDWESLMDLALDQARLAGELEEVPVGAVLVDGRGRILSRQHNRTITASDPSAHAEILVLRQAAEHMGNYRLAETILVVTLEPCLMCLGAMVHARIGGLVFGARDLKTGAVISRIQYSMLTWLNHRFPVMEGVLAERSSKLLRSFFQARRSRPLKNSVEREG